MIYTLNSNRGARGVRSPLHRLTIVARQGRVN